MFSSCKTKYNTWGTTPLFVIPYVFTCSVLRQSSMRVGWMSSRSVGWISSAWRNSPWLLLQPKDWSVSKLSDSVFSGVSPPQPLLCLPKIPGIQACWSEFIYFGWQLCLCQLQIMSKPTSATTRSMWWGLSVSLLPDSDRWILWVYCWVTQAVTSNHTTIWYSQS